MPIRLSELLDRIRPAGAPGAPSDAEPQRELAATEETSSVAALLHRLESEADEVIASAQEDADRIRADAERRAAELRSEVPDRVAVARADVSDAVEHDVTASVASIAADAQARVTDLRARADLDGAVAAVVDLIWRETEEAMP